MADKDIKVGIGDMKFTRGNGTIITYALGSCIGITSWMIIRELHAWAGKTTALAC